MGNYDFDKDLSREQKLQRWLIDELPKRYSHIVKVEPYKGRKEEADLQISLLGGTVKTIEVKEDRYHAKSGNFAIEYFSRGKPSGINVTKADYYLIILHSKPHDEQEIGDGELLFVDTAMLKAITIPPLPAWCKNKTDGGDLGSVTKKRSRGFEKIQGMAR
jgi:hypothetical protein